MYLLYYRNPRPPRRTTTPGCYHATITNMEVRPDGLLDIVFKLTSGPDAGRWLVELLWLVPMEPETVQTLADIALACFKGRDTTEWTGANLMIDVGEDNRIVRYLRADGTDPRPAIRYDEDQLILEEVA